MLILVFGWISRDVNKMKTDHLREVEKEPGMLLKLRRLENKLTDLVEKVDKEIIQTEMEWMHLKSAADVANKAFQCKTENLEENPDLKPKSGVSNNESPSMSGVSTRSISFWDVKSINAAPLELDLDFSRATCSTAMDEEFDSD
ncbi:unnamed protein product [Acanthoscelides obtectus]|uniref:Uncharacterized protein n=1 Tax=Acanthoscelides obtectus TaxID=200917 RepID=A0A9P0PZZ9_ACAOB|nr:unnamed protein product [Acanthoscelides obtectus]CAK1644545.1 hypothetical protein AOBTE_LOCUS13866 [Acanthoscelides obtectus]